MHLRFKYLLLYSLPDALSCVSVHIDRQFTVWQVLPFKYVQ